MSDGGIPFMPLGAPDFVYDAPLLHRNYVAVQETDEDKLFKSRRLFDLDGVIFFVMFLALLFLARLGTLGAAIFALTTMVYAFRHGSLAREVLREQWFFLVFPAFAIFSALWSDAPAETLKHGAEFALTVAAGLLLSTAPNQRSMMFGLFAAFAIHAALSMIMGDAVAVGNSGAMALAGLEDSKNDQADTVTNGAMISILLFWIGLQSRTWLLSLLALGMGLLEIYEGVLAKSAGAMAGFAVGVAAFFALALLRRAGQRVRLALTASSGIAGIAAALIFLLFTNEVLETLSTMFGKDMTLTGRTYLWSRARDLVAERPWLGRGYEAFWQQGNLDAEGLWQYAHITTRTGFNFHNTSNDVLVGLGWIGLALFGLTLIWGFGKAAGKYVNRPSLLACFWLSMAIHIAVRMPVETVGTYEFSYTTVFLYAVFASAGRALQQFSLQPVAGLGPRSGMDAFSTADGGYARSRAG